MNKHLPPRIFELSLQAVQDPQDVRNSSGSHPAVGSQDDLDFDSRAYSLMKLLPMDVKETMRLIHVPIR